MEPSPGNLVLLMAAKSTEYRSSSEASRAVFLLGPAPPSVSPRRVLTFHVAIRVLFPFMFLLLFRLHVRRLVGCSFPTKVRVEWAMFRSPFLDPSPTGASRVALKRTAWSHEGLPRETATQSQSPATIWLVPPDVQVSD